jgi:hypothetical protein
MTDLLTLPVRRVPTSQRLDKTIAEVGEADLRFCLGAIFAREVAEQKNVGNPASNILVDGSGGKPLSEVRRSARAYFVNRESVRRAAEDALRIITLLVRYKTGKARASIEVWLNDKPAGSVASATARMGTEDRVRIVGPGVAYGRKLYWRPVGKPKFSKRGVRRSILDIAIRRIKSRHKGLAIVEEWVETPDLARTPALAIGQNVKGRLNG